MSFCTATTTEFNNPFLIVKPSSYPVGSSIFSHPFGNAQEIAAPETRSPLSVKKPYHKW